MQLTYESVMMIVAGGLLCFAGWHLFRLSIRILGLLLGANIGYALSSVFFKTVESPVPVSWEPWVVLFFTCLFAFLGIVFIKSMVKIVLFIGGFLFGVILAAVFTGGQMETLQPVGIQIFVDNLSIWSLLSGLIFGILFIYFEKGFVILYTCSLGAYLISSRLGAQPMIFTVAFAAGTAVQFWMSRGSRVRNLSVGPKA